MTIDEFLERGEPAWNWWVSLFEGVPEYPLAVSVYIGGSVLALLIWLRVRMLPHPVGAMSWVVMFAVLFAPTVTEGENAHPNFQRSSWFDVWGHYQRSKLNVKKRITDFIDDRSRFCVGLFV